VFLLPSWLWRGSLFVRRRLLTRRNAPIIRSASTSNPIPAPMPASAPDDKPPASFPLTATAAEVVLDVAADLEPLAEVVINGRVVKYGTGETSKVPEAVLSPIVVYLVPLVTVLVLSMVCVYSLLKANPRESSWLVLESSPLLTAEKPAF